MLKRNKQELVREIFIFVSPAGNAFGIMLHERGF